MVFFRRAVLWFFGVCAFIALAVFVVDPFARYREPTFFKALYSSANSRQMIPGVLRNFEYDSVVVGNSQAQNLPLATLRDMLGWNAVKAASPACSPRVLGQFLQLAFDARGAALSNVWLSVNVASYAGTLDFGNDDVAPYLYAKNHWQDYKYLLNLDVVTQRVPKSLYATFGGGGKGYALRTNPDNMFMLDFKGENKRDFGAEKVRRDYLEDLARGARNRAAVDVETRMADVASHLICHAQNNRHATFHVVFAPMTSLAWFQFAQNGQLDSVLEFLDAMLRALAEEPNVRIIDAMSDKTLATDFSFFRDTVHYSPAMDALLIEAVRDGSRDISARDISGLLERLRDLSRTETQPDWASNVGHRMTRMDANKNKKNHSCLFALFDDFKNHSWASNVGHRITRINANENKKNIRVYSRNSMTSKIIRVHSRHSMTTKNGET